MTNERIADTIRDNMSNADKLKDLCDRATEAYLPIAEQSEMMSKIKSPVRPPISRGKIRLLFSDGMWSKEIDAEEETLP